MLVATAGARRAFTLVEAVIAIAIVVVVGGVAVVATLDMRRERLVDDDIETLREITEALHKFDTTVTVFPQSLVHLSTRPAATDNNTCGADFTATGVTAWVTAGPFWPQVISDPIELEIGTMGLTLTRVGPITPATVRAIIQISITNVDIDDAIALNDDVDADVVTGQASTTGIVQFGAPDGAGETTVTWNMAIRGC